MNRQAMHIAVIGGGPGGYEAAARAAELGARVTLIERGELGGTCLNRGCIPTKALLDSAHVLRLMKDAARYGVAAGAPQAVYPAMARRKEGVVDTLRRGVARLLMSRQVNVITGSAAFTSPGTLMVEGHGEVKADAFIVATGAHPVKPGALKDADTSDELLREVPELESLLIIGGGVIGAEFACLYAGMGANVTLAEMQPTLLPGMEPLLGETLKASLEATGVSVLTGQGVDALRRDSLGFYARIGKETIIAQRALCAIGRAPSVDGLNLHLAGVHYSPAGIPVDGMMRTNVPHICAVGDVTGGLQLAHYATRQGIIAAEALVTGRARPLPRAIPACVYTTPELASVGLTTRAAREAGYDVLTARSSLSINGRAHAMSATSGGVLIVSERRYRQILGIHIAAPTASEMISGLAMAITMEMTAEELADQVFAHPTLSECVGDAARRLLEA